MLAGCAAAPEDSGDRPTPPRIDFLPCMVSDAGGFDDKSFNQLGFEGLNEAADELGVEPIDRRVRRRDRLRPEHHEPRRPGLQPDRHRRLRALGRDRRVRARRTPTSSSPSSTTRPTTTSTARPTRRTSSRSSSTPPRPRSSPATPRPSYSKTGIVGTFGGMNFPTVTIFMDGFAQGVEYYNEREGHRRQGPRLGLGSQNGTFTGGFEAGTTRQADRSEPHRPGRRRAAARRWPDLPERRRRHPRLRQGHRPARCRRRRVRDRPDGRRPAPHLDPQGHRRRPPTTSSLAAGRATSTPTPYVGTLENDGVGIAAVPRLRADKVPRRPRRASSTRSRPASSTARSRSRPTSPAKSASTAVAVGEASCSWSPRPSAYAVPTAADDAAQSRIRNHEARTSRHHEAVRRPGRQRPHRPHGRARRDPLPPR